MVGILPLCLVLIATRLTLGNDDAIYQFFLTYRLEHTNLTTAVLLFSELGNPALYILYGTIYWKARQRHDAKTKRFVLGYVLVQVLIAFLVARILKIGIGRPRPDIGGPYTPWTLDHGHNSMPSGHTTEIVGGAVPLSFFFRNAALPFLTGAYIALLGFSRIYLGMHHVGDIFFGIVLGSVSAYLIFTLWNRE